MLEFCSTQDTSLRVTLKEAVLTNVPEAGGLFVPTEIPKIDQEFIKSIVGCDYPSMAFKVLSSLLKDQIDLKSLEEICHKAFCFDVKLKTLDKNLHCLELFHGPTLAFKDFGVRFLAELLSYYCNGQPARSILTATSGDTGGAVASAFYNRQGFNVFILYPHNKISKFQQQQITGFGQNIKAVAVNGTFDDCQKLVKQALIDPQILQKHQFCSANSINIARLLPQICYYFRAATLLNNVPRKINFSIPSGNFGNLTSAIIAKKMGLPINKLIAATNINDVVPRFLETGEYKVGKFYETISSAMDIADPSNFTRTRYFYNDSIEAMRNDIKSFAFDDVQTRKSILELFTRYNYLSDPHTAIAYLGLQNEKSQADTEGIFVGTAHPAKFQDIVESCIGSSVTFDSEIGMPGSVDIQIMQIEPTIEALKLAL